MEDVDALLKRVKTKIVAEVTDARAGISSGACSSFEDYKKRCGLVSGLEQALDVFVEEHEKLRRGTDDAGFEPD